jgi:hypothetical protein
MSIYRNRIISLLSRARDDDVLEPITEIALNQIYIYPSPNTENRNDERTAEDEKIVLCDPYLHEALCVDKYLMTNDNSDADSALRFIYSKIIQSKSNSIPIVIDYYIAISGDWIASLRVGEYYSQCLFYFSINDALFSSLTAVSENFNWLTKKLGTLNDLRGAIITLYEGYRQHHQKAIAFNLQLSPGHYVEDELPGVYKINKYINLLGECKFLFTPGIGFWPQDILLERCLKFDSRRSIYDYLNKMSHWFVPAITQNIGPERSPIQYSDLAFKKPHIAIKTPESTTIFFAFGHRFSLREERMFVCSAEQVHELVFCLQERANNGVSVSSPGYLRFKPILDFRIFDYDSLVEDDDEATSAIKSAEHKFLLECERVFGFLPLSTLNCDHRHKANLLSQCTFGIYPYGSGTATFMSLLNDRPLFNHNHPDLKYVGDKNYFDIMFRVIDKGQFIFSKDNLISAMSAVYSVSDTSWSINGALLADLVFNLLDERQLI